jgi:hypothetical protein
LPLPLPKALPRPETLARLLWRLRAFASADRPADSA